MVHSDWESIDLASNLGHLLSNHFHRSRDLLKTSPHADMTDRAITCNLANINAGKIHQKKLVIIHNHNRPEVTQLHQPLLLTLLARLGDMVFVDRSPGLPFTSGKLL